MLASLVLSALLLVILGFYALVRIQAASCEGGVYYAPLDSAEDWSVSLDVALGLDWLAPDSVDNAWTMLPLPHAWAWPLDTAEAWAWAMAQTIPRKRTPMTLRGLVYMCMV